MKEQIKPNVEMGPVVVIAEDMFLPEGTLLVYNPENSKYEYCNKDVDVSDKGETTEEIFATYSKEFVENNLGVLFIKKEYYDQPTLDDLKEDIEEYGDIVNSCSYDSDNEDDYVKGYNHGYTRGYGDKKMAEDMKWLKTFTLVEEYPWLGSVIDDMNTNIRQTHILLSKIGDSIDKIYKLER